MERSFSSSLRKGINRFIRERQISVSAFARELELYEIRPSSLRGFLAGRYNPRLERLREIGRAFVSLLQDQGLFWDERFCGEEIYSFLAGFLETDKEKALAFLLGLSEEDRNWVLDKLEEKQEKGLPGGWDEN